MADLTGKVALITGAARGQGAAEARLFAERGAQVVITDVLETEGKELAESLGAAARFVRHDVTDADSIKTAIKTVTDCTAGRIDFLFNNAGTNTAVGPIVETDIQRVRDTFEPNVCFLFLP